MAHRDVDVGMGVAAKDGCCRDNNATIHGGDRDTFAAKHGCDKNIL